MLRLDLGVPRLICFVSLGEKLLSKEIAKKHSKSIIQPVKCDALVG